MIEPIGILTVIGLVFGVLFYIVKWLTDSNDKQRKERDSIEKEIDAASNADDIMRASGRLRDKK